MSGAGYYRFDLSVTLEAPFLIAGSVPTRYGTDVAQIRDDEGRAIIPATHIRGNIRHAWAELAGSGAAGPGEVEEWFGAPGVDAEDNGGRLFFRDLIGEAGSPRGVFSRVSIDDDTGAAKPGHLIRIEEVLPIGAKMDFAGPCYALCASRAEADDLAGHLTMALSSIAALGRFKTAGYGRVDERDPEHGKVSAVFEADVLGPAVAAGGTSFDYSFGVDSPLLVGVSRPDENTLRGSTVVAGGAVKGVLAQKFMLANRFAGEADRPDRGDLAEALSRMRISAAEPVIGGRKEGGPPRLDMVESTVGSDTDTFPWPVPHRFDPKDARTICRFWPDWKELPVPGRLKRDVRTRVRIIEGTGTAKPGALFSQSAVWPRVGSQPVEWSGRIKWTGPDNGPVHQAFLKVLGQIENGAFTLGKTNARTVDGSVRAGGQATSLKQRRLYRVTLDSPCLLLRECHLSDQATYLDALDRYWSAVTDKKLRLAWEDANGNAVPDRPDGAEETDRAVFCLQEFRGGHASLRFRMYGGAGREPFVLCRAGSVFVLATDGDQAGAACCLEKLQTTNLPVAEWTDADTLVVRPVRDTPIDYRECPFGPENGYGAISVSGMDATP